MDILNNQLDDLEDNIRTKLNTIYATHNVRVVDFDIQKSYDLKFFEYNNIIYVLKEDDTWKKLRNKQPIDLYVVKDYKGYYVICKVDIMNPFDEMEKQIIDIKTVNSKLADNDVILQLTGHIYTSEYINIPFQDSFIEESINRLLP